MAAFAKWSSNSYVAYKYFVTWGITIYMLNEFKTEFREFPEFPDYVISCDCDYTKIIPTVISKE